MCVVLQHLDESMQLTFMVKEVVVEHILVGTPDYQISSVPPISTSLFVRAMFAEEICEARN